MRRYSYRMNWKFRVGNHTATLVFVLCCEVLSAQVRAGDETATLATVARTKSAALLIVDSGISSGAGLHSDASRKIFDVGNTASCALAGHVSYTPPGTQKPLFVIAAAVALWINEHPGLGFEKSAVPIMGIMADTYNREVRYVADHHLEPSRNPGESVTDLLCASFDKGNPSIYWGELTYGLDKKAICRGGFLDEVIAMEGIISLADLTQPGKRHEELVAYFYRSLEAKIALTHFLTANSSRDPAKWSSKDVRGLLFPLYSRVENDSLLHQKVGENIGVSAPNNIRVFSKKGRSTPRFEAAEW